MEQMKCGHCGGETATIMAERFNDGFSEIVLTCTKCGTRTSFHIAPPFIKKEHTEDNPTLGAFCVGWTEEKKEISGDEV